MQSPGKGKAKRNPGKKGKEIHSGKGFGETTTEHSRFDGECRNCGKYGHKASDCWYKQTNKSQGKGKGTGKSKSKVTEISESDNRKQVDDWNPSSNTSAQQPNLSHVNTIGCVDEGLWIFSLEDSKKRRYTMNWEDQSKWKTEEHELMIDSGCFGHVCPPWFAPQFPMVSHLQSRLRSHHFSKRDSEFGISRLSFLLTRHFDEWNSSLQSVGDGWRECDK